MRPPTAILVLLLLAIAAAGCTTPAAQPQGNGTIQVTSVPAGAEIWLDGTYRGTTPGAISSIVPAGRHTVEVCKSGYEPVMQTVVVTPGGMEGVSVTLVSTGITLPVTAVPAATATEGVPQIHVDGYWTYPPGTGSTGNPVPLIVHTEAFNVGPADAREVTVSANFYYEGRMVCWNTVYLGTLAAGGHVSRDSMVSCTLPSSLTGTDLVVRFENVVVT
jgi:PEGA domain